MAQTHKKSDTPRASGYSRQQLTRLVKRGAERAPLKKRYRGSRTSFSSLYTPADVLQLAQTDSLHGTLSGPATKKLMERASQALDQNSPRHHPDRHPPRTGSQ